MDNSEVLYTRELPGGGFVAIEAVAGGESRCRARVTVERRSDPMRRAGHNPPVIAELEGDTRPSVFSALYRIASDNVAIASGILRWQMQRQQPPRAD